MKKLTNAVCLTIWNKLPKPSLRAARSESERLGYINPITARPYTRQWIRVLMSETPEGRMKLGRPPGSASLHAEHKKPVIVEDNPKVLTWYREHGFLGYQIVPPDKATVALVEHRMVYGDLPVSLARHARTVWIPELKDGECHLLEYKVRRIQ